MGSFYPKHNISEKLWVMTLKGDAKFMEKLTRGLKMRRNMVHFRASNWNSKNVHLMGPFVERI